MWGVRTKLALDSFEFNGDANFFAHQDTAGFEGCVPDQPVVSTVDFGAGIKAGAGGAPWAFGFTRKVGVEDNGVGYPLDCQSTMNLAGVFASYFNRRAFEGKVREGGYVKEVS